MYIQYFPRKKQLKQAELSGYKFITKLKKFIGWLLKKLYEYSTVKIDKNIIFKFNR